MVISIGLALNNNAEIDVNILVDMLNAQIQQNKELRESNQKLTTEVHILNEKLDYFMNRQFGRSKERLGSDVSGQLNLFSEISEELPDTLPEEEETTEVKGHRRKKGQKASKLAHLPLREVHHELPNDERQCEYCGNELTDIGGTKLREEVRFHQAALDRLAHIQHTYCCRECEKVDVASYKKALVPKPVISNSIGSSSVIVETIRQKFGQKVPANRQINFWKDSLGCIGGADVFLDPF